MNAWSLAIVVAAVGGVVAGALVRAESGPPPIGTAKPTPGPADTAPVPEQAAPPTVHTSCADELAQASEEIDWWREQMASKTSATASPEASPSAEPANPVAQSPAIPPVISEPAKANALPTATALMAAADPRLAAVPLAANDVAPLGAPQPVLDRPRLGQVAALLKDMKPREAAQVVAGLDDALAVGALSRMSPRSASAIAAALPAEHAARLLTRLSQLPLPVDKEVP